MKKEKIDQCVEKGVSKGEIKIENVVKSWKRKARSEKGKGVEKLEVKIKHIVELEIGKNLFGMIWRQWREIKDSVLFTLRLLEEYSLRLTISLTRRYENYVLECSRVGEPSSAL